MNQKEMFKIETSDRINLYGVKSVASDNKAVVVIVHGFAEHLGRYDFLNENLLNSNFTVYQFDNRGHGKSEGKIGHVNDFNDYILDTDMVVEKALKENPNVPLFMIGHSMGGFIAFLYGLRHYDKLSGQILSGAATDYNPEIQGLKGILIKLANLVYPDLLIRNDLSALISRDESVVSSYKSDHLVFDRATARFYYQFLIKGINFLVADRHNYKCPCLILHGEQDRIINKSASEKLYHSVSSEDKTLKIYKNLYHEIFNEPEKSQVISDVLKWIDTRC